MRIGGSIALALIVFGAGLMAAPGVRAQQDQDAAPPIYVTPDSDHSAKPLFLQKLFGTDGNTTMVGKPFDFSHRNDSPEQHRGPNKDLQDKIDHTLAEQHAVVLEMFERARKANLENSAQQRAEIRAEQAKIRAQSIASSQAGRPTMPPNIPHIGRPQVLRGQKEGGGSRTLYNGQRRQNPRPPIFVQH